MSDGQKTEISAEGVVIGAPISVESVELLPHLVSLGPKSVSEMAMGPSPGKLALRYSQDC